VVNKIIMMYLRCFTRDRPRQWTNWLPWAEFYYNSVFQSSLHTSLFKVVYGRDPPSIRSYMTGDARLSMVHQQMTGDARLHEWLDQAQQHYKLFYDKKHQELEFEVGQWV
jgi:hypothetical protein